MKERINIGISISKNYNVVKLELLDHEIESAGPIDRSKVIQGLYDELSKEVEERHARING